jgi:anti-sigma regulatory factor (Ser/Thr protein kinase)
LERAAAREGERPDAGGDHPPVATLRLTLPARASAARTARRHLAELAAHVPTEVLDTARLLVSEVVGNAYRHAGLGPDDPIRLRVRVADRVRVEVVDGGRGFDGRPRPAVGPHEVGGYGLVLVDRLASRWGVSRRGGVTRVWFELDLAA